MQKFFDYLELRGAGSLIWVSPFAPVVEQGWTVYDALLPNAANNPNVVIEFRLVTDGFVHYGGWNLDDVELYSLAYPVAPESTLTLLPEQCTQGSTVTLQVTTNGAQPFLLALGDTAGPLPIPGFPTLQVGGNLITLFGATATNGTWTTTFAAPQVAITGAAYWSQLLTWNGTAVITSNPFRNLFTQ